MGMVNSNFLPATQGLSLGNQNQLWNAALNNISISGSVSYNGVQTVGSGLVTVVAAVDITGQGFAQGTSVLYMVPSSGNSFQYRLTWNSKITTSAGVSSTLGPLQFSYIDPDGTGQGITSGALTGVGALTTTQTANSVFTFLTGIPVMMNCMPGSSINLNSFGYASNPANAMKYNLHIRLEAI